MTRKGIVRMIFDWIQEGRQNQQKENANIVERAQRVAAATTELDQRAVKEGWEYVYLQSTYASETEVCDHADQLLKALAPEQMQSLQVNVLLKDLKRNPLKISGNSLPDWIKAPFFIPQLFRIAEAADTKYPIRMRAALLLYSLGADKSRV